jgi:hypothetical protein
VSIPVYLSAEVLAMNLHTLTYLRRPTIEPVDPTLGLVDLRKGLNTILRGYLLLVGAILAACAVVGYLIIQAGDQPLPRQVLGRASTLLFTMALVLGLAAIGSLTLIVRGKWICLSSAPERFHARWMMFMSILCVLAVPALNAGAILIGECKADNRGRARNQTSTLLHQLDEYKNGKLDLDTLGYVKLAGQAFGLLSGIFFILFLRAVALGWGAEWRARFAELYLLFLALLIAGVVALLWKPSYMMARPRLLLGLAAGWLIAGLWYFALILSMVIGIGNMLARRSRA